MNSKLISIIAVSIAVIAAAVAAIVVSINRSNEAKAYAEAEAAEADAAAAEARTAKAAADAEAEKRRTAEATKDAKADEKKTQELAKETAELEKKAAEEKARAKSAEAAKAASEAETARAKKETARANADAAKAEQLKAKELAVIETEKAEAAAANLAIEKLKNDKVIAEAKLLELRKIDFETLERDLNEWRLDLEERERALQPEKTIADLSWAGGIEDSIIDDKGNIKKQVKEKYDPEKDVSLPSTSRNLAKTQRIALEKHEAMGMKTRASIVSSMEKLYVDALKENRVIDADFYRKSILSMYPDWKFSGDSVTNSVSTPLHNEAK